MRWGINTTASSWSISNSNALSLQIETPSKYLAFGQTVRPALGGVGTAISPKSSTNQGDGQVSRYIERAHNMFVEAATTIAVAVRSRRPAVAVGIRARASASGQQPAPYNSPERRLANLVEAVARGEHNLAQARQSAASGSKSPGFLASLSRRLHQARVELAAFRAGEPALGLGVD